ncbi:MAG TPA: alpha/beta hydrolase [Spirochaetota bacterium]|nr:alpha/beta hydrolase [Spirochaetota bacterium]HOM38687.1 alpha/beta hydrolase [Spirochaetota bacterium]HPQ49797.1 alpha/beta hydrolase [Spirochaetota bacterium]
MVVPVNSLEINEKDIVINGTKYHYFEVPNIGKPKIFMVHGLMVDSHCFLGIIQYLKDNYHIYSIDLKGHGKSDNGKDYYSSYTPTIIADEFYQFYKEVIKENFTYIGYSLGGQYGIAYAGKYQDTLKSLIIIDSAPSISTRGSFSIMFANTVTPKVFKDKNHVINFYDKSIKGLGEYMTNYCVIENSKGYTLRFDKNIAPPTVIGMIRRDRELWTHFSKINIPFLLIKAKKSEIINNRIVMLMKQINKNINTVEVDGKHTFVFTNPEKIAEQIINFLKDK